MTKGDNGVYNASSAFHQAVADDEPQIALLIFDDAIFSSSDINVQNGIEFHDYFNAEEDIAIGQALSNEIRFTLFNDERLLNLYEFGEFQATIGVRISTGEYVDSAYVMAYDGNTVWRGNRTAPYLTMSRIAVSSQPDFPVQSIAVYNNKVYAIGDNGQYKVYTQEGVPTGDTLNAFMREKIKAWDGMGIVLDGPGNMLYLNKDGTSETY